MDVLGAQSDAQASVTAGLETSAGEARDVGDIREPSAFATGDAHTATDDAQQHTASIEVIHPIADVNHVQSGTQCAPNESQVAPTTNSTPEDQMAGADVTMQELGDNVTFDAALQPNQSIEDEVKLSSATLSDEGQVHTAHVEPNTNGSTMPQEVPQEDGITNASATLDHDKVQPTTLVSESEVPASDPPVICDGARGLPAHSGIEIDGSDIKYDYDHVEGHRILRLRPTKEQWDDFPAVLAYARSLGAEGDGCFKVIIPDELQDELPEKPAESLPANAYKVKLIRRTTFWQVSTVPSEGVFATSQPGQEFSDSVDAALKNLKHLFRKNQNRQLRNIRYRVDVPAWTKTQRRLAGVPEISPIYPLKGDKLDDTKAVIPGIHTPYVYESASSFGATFQIHAEDFRLASLNHLYKGRKIWIVIPATDVDIAERALGRGSGCSQFMRHRAEFFFPDKLDKLGIPYRIVDQRPGETIVILPDAYHEGFSCGYTIAEAKNYADPAWNTDSYQPCEASCRLATAIPAAFMRPLQEGEERLDLCAAYGDGLSIPLPGPVIDVPKKREYDETDDQDAPSDLLDTQDIKRIKVYE